MIQTPPFIDLHTHTRYPDNNSFPINEIEDAAINGGYSDVLAMANSEIPIDSIANLNIAREFDEKLKIKIHRVGALTENLEGKNLTNFKEFIEITNIFDAPSVALTFQVSAQDTQVFANGEIVATLQGVQHFNPDRHALFIGFDAFDL